MPSLIDQDGNIIWFTDSQWQRILVNQRKHIYQKLREARGGLLEDIITEIEKEFQYGMGLNKTTDEASTEMAGTS